MARFKSSWTPATGLLNANEIYSFSLYNPKANVVTGPVSSGDTFELLNGGLSSENLSGKLDAHCFRNGTFARGHYYGFNFPDRFHASQFIPSSNFTKSGGAIPNRNFTSHYSLSYQFFCPWPAICFIGYQGFFASDTTQFDPEDGIFEDKDPGSVYEGEDWHMRLLINGDIKSGSFSKIPSSRRDGTGPGQEHRWRWVHRSRSFEAAKGYNTVDLRIWPNVLRPYTGTVTGTEGFIALGDKVDNPIIPPKLATLTGGIWVLALRRGTDSNNGPVEHNEFDTSEEGQQ